MSARHQKYPLLILVLLVGLAVLLTCSDRIVNSDATKNIEFAVAVKFADQAQQDLAEIVTTYRVTIIAAEDTIVANLAYANGIISGVIEGVPAGTDRTIMVEGIAADGTVIYRGTATVNVVAGQTVDVEITLLPVGKLVRLSPKFASKSYGESLVSTIKIDNIKGVTALGAAIDFNSAIVHLDSIKAGAELPEGTTFTFDDESAGHVTINISNESVIVDSSGNASVARLFFKAALSNKCIDSTDLDLTVISLTAPGLTADSIYVDDSKALIDRAKLAVSVDTLRFGAGVEGLNLEFKKVEISDSCGRNVPFTVSKDADWIDLNTALAGITPGSIFIDVDTTGLPSGSYQGKVKVRSLHAVNSPYDILVKLTIDHGARILDVVPDTLYFTAFENDILPSSQTFRVLETGGYHISFAANEEISWLNLSGVSGNTPDTITASITTTELEPNIYTGTILISSEDADNSPQHVTVVYELIHIPKLLAVDPISLHFNVQQAGELPSSQTFVVYETGSLPISFSASEEVSWFSIAGVSGTTPDTIAVSITTTDLNPGLYHDSVRISSGEADNSPIYLFVSLGVSVGTRNIEAEPDTLHFSAQENGKTPFPQMFRVFESNGYVISYSAVESIEWLNLTDISGHTADTVTANITNTELEPGTYFDSIEINSEAGNAPIYVFVSYEISAIPRLIEVEPDSLHFTFVQNSDAYPTGQFRIFEPHGYHITYSAVEDIPWLFLSKGSGTTEDTITVYTNPDIEPGTYVDSIEVSSEIAVNSLVFVRVILDVIASPKFIHVAPDTLHFIAQVNGGLPESKTFQVFETNGRNIAFSALGSIEWLNLSGVSGTTADTISINITTTELDPSTYFDSVRIASDEANNSPVFEYVEYIVGPFVDSIPPSSVTDLNVDDNSATSVFLTWTASGDDGTIGTATETDLRYATDLEALLGWDGATKVQNESAPLPSGSSEHIEIGDLTPGFTYYFALKIIDDANNVSGISNVDSVYLPPLIPSEPILISPENNAINLPVDLNFIWHSSARADYYELRIDTVVPFSQPIIYTNIQDTAFQVHSLQFGTKYYWQIFAINHYGSNGSNQIGIFRTVPFLSPSIRGDVADIYGNKLGGVQIYVYDEYPEGRILDSTITNDSGYFQFYNTPYLVSLYFFKEGYYPGATGLTPGTLYILVTLAQLADFTPTDKWIDLYCASSYVHGHPLQPNDVVEAYDPGGVLCGRFIVKTAGAYGFMPVYADDPYTPTIDEGCEPLDPVTIEVNGQIAKTNQPLVYPAAYEKIEACFNVTGEIPKWIVVTKPAGGEIFYQDSIVSVEWSSTGISGPVEISLGQSERSTLPLDTTDNDGQHNITIPIGISNSDNWHIVVRDLDENVSGKSNSFSIGAVEITPQPSSLSFHGVVGSCLPTQKQFTVSEVNGFHIPFQIVDTVSWLSVTPTSGTTPQLITVNILPNALPLGNYSRSLPITSTNAVNSPSSVSISLEIGQYACGDFNNDCRLRIGDLADLFDYLYRSGPTPLYPDALNVDLCDGVDIADVDYLNTLVAFDSPPLCEGAPVCTNESNDLGIRDSLKFVVAHAPSSADSIPHLQLNLFLNDDANIVNGLASGFGWDNPNLHLDSVKYSPYVKDSLSLHVAFEDDNLDSTNANHRFLLAANRTIFSGLKPAASSQLLASYYFTLSSWTSVDSIVVDTLTFSQGTTYKVASSNGTYRPVWPGRIVVKEPGL